MSVANAKISDLAKANKNFYFFRIFNSSYKYDSISWKSRTIQHVVKNTLAAETLALEEALEECYMIRLILLEIYNKKSNSESFPIHCYNDKKSLLDSVYSTKTLK